MAVKFIILLACFALSQGSVVRRDAPVPTSNPLQDIEKAFSEQFQAITNSMNAEEVNKSIKDGADSVLEQMSTLSASLQSALTDANGEAKEALEQTRQSIEKTVEELRRSHPDVEKHANELRDKLQAAVQSTLQ